jgi:hypothetical protein
MNKCCFFECELRDTLNQMSKEEIIEALVLYFKGEA